MMNAYPRAGGFSPMPHQPVPPPARPTPLAHFVANAILTNLLRQHSTPKPMMPPVQHVRDPLINHLQAAMNPQPMVPHVPQISFGGPVY